MATTTTYTSKVTVPIYASWRCEKCGKVNFSPGNYTCVRQESTTSGRTSRHLEAKTSAHDAVKSEWAQETFGVISAPNIFAKEMRSGATMLNTNCTKCGKKARWDKNMRYKTWMGLSVLPAILAGVGVKSEPGNGYYWILFAVFCGIFLAAATSMIRYTSMMKKLPKENLPVIGSQNQELIAYAMKHYSSIPSPEETFRTVLAYAPPAEQSNAHTDKWL